MGSSAYETYADSRVLSADPLELILILYQEALESVERARGYLREGDIAARSREISRTCAILAELSVSLRRDADPTIVSNLVELYDYMQRRLLEANMQQVEPPLVEVSHLLTTLLDGWRQCRQTIAAEPAAEPVPVPAGAEEEYVSQSWTA